MDHMHRTKREVLATSVFGELTPRQLDDVAHICDERHFEPGDVLCGEGEFGTIAFVVAEGRVAIESGGDRVDVAEPGRLLGDWAMFGSGYRTATLRALTPVDVVVVDPREVDTLLAAVPACASRVGPHAATVAGQR